MNRVRDKIALVTGAALGLGGASARVLVSESARVVCPDRYKRRRRRARSRTDPRTRQRGGLSASSRRRHNQRSHRSI